MATRLPLFADLTRGLRRFTAKVDELHLKYRKMAAEEDDVLNLHTMAIEVDNGFLAKKRSDSNGVFFSLTETSCNSSDSEDGFVTEEEHSLKDGESSDEDGEVLCATSRPRTRWKVHVEPVDVLLDIVLSDKEKAFEKLQRREGNPNRQHLKTRVPVGCGRPRQGPADQAKRPSPKRRRIELTPCPSNVSWARSSNQPSSQTTRSPGQSSLSSLITRFTDSRSTYSRGSRSTHSLDRQDIHCPDYHQVNPNPPLSHSTSLDLPDSDTSRRSVSYGDGSCGAPRSAGRLEFAEKTNNFQFGGNRRRNAIFPPRSHSQASMELSTHDSGFSSFSNTSRDGLIRSLSADEISLVRQYKQLNEPSLESDRRRHLANFNKTVLSLDSSFSLSNSNESLMNETLTTDLDNSSLMRSQTSDFGSHPSQRYVCSRAELCTGERISSDKMLGGDDTSSLTPMRHTGSRKSSSEKIHTSEDSTFKMPDIPRRCMTPTRQELRSPHSSTHRSLSHSPSSVVTRHFHALSVNSPSHLRTLSPWRTLKDTHLRTHSLSYE